MNKYILLFNFLKQSKCVRSALKFYWICCVNVVEWYVYANMIPEKFASKNSFESDTF